ncbi:MAG: dihydroorotate dehydrogenase-like protein [Candidatus Azobacteroides sp.]|nr:dihydroorotate dehydrogenase-like protein [Candidatus Azobacteroides sp.]
MKTLFETQFAGLTLSSPIIIASSGLTGSAYKNKDLEKAGAGALVLKSLFEEQFSKNAISSLINEKYSETNDYILPYFKRNAINDYLRLIQKTKESCQIPVIASVICYKDDTWVDFAHQIEMAGADALELNICALNARLDSRSDFLEEIYLRITQKLKEAVHIPIIVKMGKYFSHIVGLVDQLHTAGVSGFVLFNRLYQLDIDITHLQMTSGQIFSSHSDISDTLRWTGIISSELPSAPIAASTGIHDWESIIKCILAGASVVQICTAVYQSGNEIIAQMKHSIEEWMQSMNFHSLNDFRGRLNYAQIPDPSVYERIQFMKYFSNRD